ncbi:MAG: hypothetical protein HY711_07560 [Candidatus Melainabacteria bacterium]|nr:hypothetical protein [Candidatus Melainabacteria bacterium]
MFFLKLQVSRAPKGSLGAVLFGIVLFAILGIGAFALDFAHVLTVQSELQNATDAAALAGAQDLTTNFDNVVPRALQVASSNRADGKAVSNQSPGAIITVNPIPPNLPLDTGSVTVTASMSIRHMLAPIFGRTVDTLVSQSTAGSSGSLNRLGSNQAFPLAVSLDAVPRNNNIDGQPLYSRQLGDTVDFYINSQQVKNASFTSFTECSSNANYIKGAVAQSLGLEPVQPGFIPSIQVGDSININNGVVGQKHLARSPQFEALTSQPILILPVITGTPPYNQSRQVVGFIGVRVTTVTINQSGGEVETITGTLVRQLARGRGGPTGQTGSPVADAALLDLSASPLRLLANNP